MFATVGSSPRGLKAAVLARNTNAFAPAVENAAVPPVSVAPAVAPSVPQTSRLDAVNTSRADPVRICMLPVGAVSRLSPANTVAPTDAATVPSRPPSEDTIVPEPKLGFPKTGDATKLIDNMIDRMIGRVPR